MDGVLGVTQWYVMFHQFNTAPITLNIYIISVIVVSRQVEISLTKFLSTNSGEPIGSIPIKSGSFLSLDFIS